MASTSEFSRTLSLLRKERGVSQRTAAGDLGISQALLSHYENGVREPGLSFVVKACDYYNVSADFILGRTLSREGSMLTSEEVLNAAEPGNILPGSDKAAINAAADYLGGAVYQLYRHLYRSAGANEDYFALNSDDCAMDVSDADRKLAELRYVHALRDQEAQKAEFPDLSPDALTAAYPGRCQSMTQVLSTADARLNGLTEQ